jgi:ArsR family transcriptional regulator
VDDSAVVRVLKALADPTRFRIVREVARASELNCGQVCALFSLSQPTISHHLKLLADAGVLVVRREGQRAHVTVNRELLDAVLALVPERLGPAKARSRRRGAGRRAR